MLVLWRQIATILKSAHLENIFQMGDLFSFRIKLDIIIGMFGSS